MNYAVIGAGYWGSNHVRVGAELRDEGNVDTLTLCDLDEERVKNLAQSFDAQFVTDYRELPSAGIDAATVATPSPTHPEIALYLLRNGIDVLVEKPIALASDDAWEMVQTADDHGRTLVVGHIFRYHPALNELKRRIDRGELGELRYMNTHRFSFRVPRTTTGVLYSLAVHDIDVSNFLLDNTPLSIYCNLDSTIREGVDETATLILEYGGATSVINESWQVPVFGKRRDIVVVGTEKAAYIDYLQDNEVELHHSRVESRGGSLNALREGKKTYEVANQEPLRVEVEEFVEASQNGSETRSPGRIGAETVELLEKSLDSDRASEVVQIDR